MKPNNNRNNKNPKQPSTIQSKSNVKKESKQYTVQKKGTNEVIQGHQAGVDQEEIDNLDKYENETGMLKKFGIDTENYKEIFNENDENNEENYEDDYNVSLMDTEEDENGANREFYNQVQIVENTNVKEIDYIEKTDDMNSLEWRYIDIMNTVKLLTEKRNIEQYTVDELNMLLNQYTPIVFISQRTGNSSLPFFYLETNKINQMLNVMAYSYSTRPQNTRTTKMTYQKKNATVTENVSYVSGYFKVTFKDSAHTVRTCTDTGASSNIIIGAGNMVKASATDSEKRTFRNLGNLFGLSLWTSEYINKLRKLSFMIYYRVDVTSFADIRKAILLNILYMMFADSANEDDPKYKDKLKDDITQFIKRFIFKNSPDKYIYDPVTIYDEAKITDLVDMIKTYLGEGRLQKVNTKHPFVGSGISDQQINDIVGDYNNGFAEKIPEKNEMEVEPEKKEDGNGNGNAEILDWDYLGSLI